jgi:two-component system, NtrC family, nitrogen regulation sensor histidine kinase NtrY
MQLTKTYRNLLIAMAVAFALGFLFDILYRTSASNSIDIKHFQEVIYKKEKEADKLSKLVTNQIISGNIEVLHKTALQSRDIAIYVQKNKALLYWSDNHIDINPNDCVPSDEFELKFYSNAWCLEKHIQQDSLEIITLIFLKHNFPYQNDVLRNEFAAEFKTDESILIKTGNNTDKYAIFNSQGKYLFTLAQPETPVFDNRAGIAAFVFFALAVLLFFIALANFYHISKNKWLTLKQYFAVVISTGVFTGFSLWFKVPSMLYWDVLFSAQQYAFNPLLSSVTHLSISVFFLTSIGFLFYSGVRFKENQKKDVGIILQIITILFFVLIYIIIRSLVFHSGIQLNIINFREISYVSVWLHLLIFLPAVSFGLIFFKIRNYFHANKKLKTAIITDVILILISAALMSFFTLSDVLIIIPALIATFAVFYLSYLFKTIKSFYWLLPLWIFVYTCFFIFSSLTMSNQKKAEKYKLLAQNIMINGNVETDRLTEIMLEELDAQLTADKRIGQMVLHPDSVLAANNYLNKKYLRGYWNKFEMRLNMASANTELYLQFRQLIADNGEKIASTHFYKIPASKAGMAFLGVFSTEIQKNDSVYYYMQFFPRRNFTSYSFPGFLLSPVQEMSGNHNISVIKYENGKTVYLSGDTDYLSAIKISEKSDKEFSIINHKGKIIYKYWQSKGNFVLITENAAQNLTGYLLYFIYTFLIFYALVWLAVRLYHIVYLKKKTVIGFTTKFQYAFIILLIVSFMGIFYVSVNFIQRNYKEEQISKIENKKKYIQKALQNIYYWTQNLTDINAQALNLDLQELSYIYETDIHVYNNNGELVGSSQPLIFNRNLTGTRISPVPYFSANAELTQYESIGRLRYLVSYTDFYNGDFLQIGFIALPQFLSQEEIQRQITDFLSVVVHIYLIVIFLVIFLSLIIGKQLSAPLIMIENKLKMMRFGHRNEKIDYQANDEIGQLVEQYNRTIDELENSARQLAKSERESAWKTMARQIAHEINNPLTPMKLTIQQLQRTFNINDNNFEEYFKKSTTVLIEQIDNLSRIAATFSNFARLPEAQFRRVDVAAKLSSAVQLFAHNHEQIEVNYSGLNEGIFVFADPEQLMQVFNNLLKNAIQAIQAYKKGRIDVKIHKAGQQIFIDIADNGIGIDVDVAESIFTPNFTTKSTGMGLGLTISKNIIEISGGSINFVSKPKRGTTFTIILPSED